jgi:antitoxin component of RelBE/YafQ-DinJ toxin-antitoxin module
MNKIELIAELRKIDEVTLLELLQLTSDDLVDMFLDKIAENQGKLLQYVYDN